MNFPPQFPILGSLIAGTKQRHEVTLPGADQSDSPRPVITVTGVKPEKILLVGAGVHGGEYPAIEAVIRLARELEPTDLAGTVVLMPVLNLPAFWNRSMFVCPVDGVNPNRVFPGDSAGSYSEQMTHAFVHEFIMHADAYLDLHGGDIPEALVPFTTFAGRARRKLTGRARNSRSPSVCPTSSLSAARFNKPRLRQLRRLCGIGSAGRPI